MYISLFIIMMERNLSQISTMAFFNILNLHPVSINQFISLCILLEFI